MADVGAALDALAPVPGSFVSLTGGEPLLQPESVQALAVLVRNRGLGVYLETHGLASGALERVVDELDVVSMDWKLASDVRWADPARSGESGFDARHEEFLGLAYSRAEVFVKVVVTCKTRPEELDEVCHRVARVAPGAALILQPVTPFGRVRETPSAAELLAALRRCEAIHRDTRLIPQTHRIYGAL
jgi:pyruvate-formate lyase-activating enzyme